MKRDVRGRERLLRSSMAAEGPGAPLGLLLLMLSSVDYISCWRLTEVFQVSLLALSLRAETLGVPAVEDFNLAHSVPGAALELSVVSPVTAAVGSDVLLECAYTVESPSVNLKYLGILWRFNESNLLVYGPGMKVFNPRASMNESEIPNGKASLLLSNVTTSDEGPYTCYIIYTPKKKQKTVTLNIQVDEEKGVNAAAVVLPLLLVLALVAVLGGFLYRRRTKPQGTGSIDCIPCNGGKVKCSLELTQFYPHKIEINWSCGKGSLRVIPSADHVSQNGDHRTFAARSECEILEENFSDPNFKIRVSWKHESLKDPGFKEMSVTHSDFPGRPVAGDIVVPRLVSGEEASLHCPVSGYFPSKGLEVMWLKLKKGSSAPVPLSGGNDGCVSSMTPEQKEHLYSCTAQLAFTPDFHSDQESEFICQVSHPSLLKALEKRTPKLSIMSAPRCGDVTIAPSGDGELVILNVTNVYPKQTAISWICDLPGKVGELHSEDKYLESSDGTYSIASHCRLTEHMIRKIAQADIIVSIQHNALKEPSRVTMRLENIDNKWIVKVLEP